MLDSGGIGVHSEHLAPLAKQINEISSVPASGVEHTHARGDISAQNLIEYINIDLPELLLNGQRHSVAIVSHLQVVSGFSMVTPARRLARLAPQRMLSYAENMRNATPIQNERQFSALVEAAKSGPVTIEREDRELAVLLSIDDYERMRNSHLEPLRRVGSQISNEAKANGLTEETLERLLAEG
jgi:prevent-host-death family protein